MSQLEGMVMVDRNSSPPVVWLCCVEDMPQDVIQRFQHLFSLRDKWTLADITPYIRQVISYFM